MHPRFKTPWKSTILVGVVVGLGGALAPLGFLADLVSIGTLFAFVIVSAAVWILRITDPAVPRPFRTPFAPFVSIMGVLVNGALMFSLGHDNWIRLVAWLILGMLIYLGYSRHHSVLGKRTTARTSSKRILQLQRPARFRTIERRACEGRSLSCGGLMMPARRLPRFHRFIALLILFVGSHSLIGRIARPATATHRGRCRRTTSSRHASARVLEGGTNLAAARRAEFGNSRPLRIG